MNVDLSAFFFLSPLLVILSYTHTVILIPIHYNGIHLQISSPSEFIKEGVKITLCSRTENKLSRQTSHLLLSQHTKEPPLSQPEALTEVRCQWVSPTAHLNPMEPPDVGWDPPSGRSPGPSRWSSQLRYLSRKWRCLVRHDILFSVSLHNAIFSRATKLSDKLWEHLSQLDSEKIQCILSFIYLFISLYSMFSMTE